MGGRLLRSLALYVINQLIDFIMARTKFPVRILHKSEYEKFNLAQFPNFHRSGSITGMRRIYGIDAKLVRCGNYIYNVTAEPQIYDAAH